MNQSLHALEIKVQGTAPNYIKASFENNGLRAIVPRLFFRSATCICGCYWGQIGHILKDIPVLRGTSAAELARIKEG